MSNLSHTGGNTAANFAQASGLRYLAKKHGHELIPTAEPFGILFSSMLMDQSMKHVPIEQSYQLTKQTRVAYHGASSLLLANGWFWRTNHASQGGFFSTNF